MRYRGGGISHMYMREVENRFKDMNREQVNPEGGQQAARLSLDEDCGAGGVPASATKTTTSARSPPMATNSDNNDYSEAEDSENEWVDILPGEDDYLGEEEREGDSDDSDNDEVGQGTYGLGKY